MSYISQNSVCENGKICIFHTFLLYIVCGEKYNIERDKHRTLSPKFL